MSISVDRIPVCDRQTDRQTSCDDIVSAMYTRRAVINERMADSIALFGCMTTNGRLSRFSHCPVVPMSRATWTCPQGG